MFKRCFTIILVIVSLVLHAQSVKGIVYDEEATVKGAKVLNITQQIVTATTVEGTFEITAKLSDTLYFQSSFHNPKYVIVNENFFEGTYVFELKKAINQLDEVKIKDNPKDLVFGEEAFNKSVTAIIAADKENNSGIYQVASAPKYGVDFIQIFKKIGTLFKKKKTNTVQTLTYNQLKTLFETNTFFDQQLLAQDLNIEVQLQSLFFEFCENKNIPVSLLNYNSRLELLNTFMLCSEEFRLIVEFSLPKK